MLNVLDSCLAHLAIMLPSMVPKHLEPSVRVSLLNLLVHLPKHFNEVLTLEIDLVPLGIGSDRG